MPGLLKIAVRSLRYYVKQAVYQSLIIAILCAVITGSLLTGHSVRSSLRHTASEHLGNTGILISSGVRYFDRDLAVKLRNSGIDCEGFLEIKGSSQSLVSQKSEYNTSIFAVPDGFFSFNGSDSLEIKPGEVIINERLADQLGINAGDDVVIRFSEISDIPADAPFAPESEESMSLVLKAGVIAGKNENGNFSLTISQITPFNVFLSIDDLDSFFGREFKYNRLIIDRSSGMTIEETTTLLADNLEPRHAGLKTRLSNAGQAEITSDRIFLDEPLIQTISSRLPGAAPVITYLANSIENDGKVTPYSFVSAIPGSIYGDAPSNGSIIINTWLAADLDASVGDTLKLAWYSPDSLNHLIEKSRLFTVERIVGIEGIWGDSTLMPEFPGIAGSESCSHWDAGVPININEIRQKDEDYWRDYRGTPKAFINYETGREIWGSNYGPATSIRFPERVSIGEIEKSLTGTIDPSSTGFFVSDIWSESLKAADNSVDFGTLFLSLGFFLILASLVLLSFAVSYYFEMKRRDIATFFSLGFKNSAIRKLLFTESLLTSVAGCLVGSVLGFLVNAAVISALNSVWQGAVRTNTLSPDIDVPTIVLGFASTLVVILLFMFLKTGRLLGMLKEKSKSHYNPPSRWLNLVFLVTSFAGAILLFILSRMNSEREVMLGFLSGAFLFVALILAWRQYWMKPPSVKLTYSAGSAMISRKYFSFYPSNAVTPVLFIAAGVFAVFITIVNRKDFSSGMNDRSSGTGGYKLWIETSIPVGEDIDSGPGRLSFGLDDDSLSGLTFVQMKRLSGNDASCLNLNHITAPPLLGADPDDFINAGAFSFSGSLTRDKELNPWELLEAEAGNSAIYGIADQTVLDWGLKIGVGDTLVLRAETGQRLDIIIAAGLKTSVFQGYVLISKANLTRYFPSVSGNSVFLADFTGSPDNYSELLTERFYNNAPHITSTSERLSNFYQITNTYLSVFGVFGALGMITGIAGLGFVLLRNYSRRKREFALMIALGFRMERIRKMVLSEQVTILIAGLFSGLIPAIVSTLPSVRTNHEVSWFYLAGICIAIFLTGLLATILSLKAITPGNLVSDLRRD